MRLSAEASRRECWVIHMPSVCPITRVGDVSHTSEGGIYIYDGGSGHFAEVFVTLLNFALEIDKLPDFTRVNFSLATVMAHCASG